VFIVLVVVVLPVVFLKKREDIAGSTPPPNALHPSPPTHHHRSLTCEEDESQMVRPTVSLSRAHTNGSPNTEEEEADLHHRKWKWFLCGMVRFETSSKREITFLSGGCSLSPKLLTHLLTIRPLQKQKLLYQGNGIK